MLSVREAIEQLVPCFRPLGTERVALPDTAERVLAVNLRARQDWPSFDHSAMDGYAVGWDALREAQPMPVSVEIRAGDKPQPLAAGTAARIFTGAPLPPGADTVVIQEDSSRSAGQVSFSSIPERGANVRPRGFELRAGEPLFDAGTLLGPSEIGLLAAHGYAQVEVFRRPRVALLPTGNELRALTATDEPFTIVDSNSYALSAALKRAGCVPEPLGIASDDPAVIRRFVERGLQCDALITIGGVSVGDYDLVGESLRAAGVRVEFHKVAIKPGKPLLFGLYDSGGRTTPVVGLPGNPVSALVVFEVFVRPGLLRMQGLRDVFPQAIAVKLASGYRRKPGRTELVRAQLRYEAGVWVADLHRHQGSGSMTSLTKNSALVIVPAERGDLAPGETLNAIVPSLPRRSDPAFAG